MKNGNALNFSNSLVKMTKHEGNGNDFLVLLDIEDHFHFSDNTIRWLCDRRRGVGADGFIRAVGLSGESVSVIDKVQKTASGIAMERAAASEDSTSLTVEYGVGHTGKNHKDGGYDAFMELTNADGTRAEMSGNGIRCLAQAIYDFRHDGDNSTGGLGGLSGSEASVIRIVTDAGVKDVLYQPGSQPGSQPGIQSGIQSGSQPGIQSGIQSGSQPGSKSGNDTWFGNASVDMGRVTVHNTLPVDSSEGIRAITDREPVWVDVGNPHLVLIGDYPVPGELESVAPKIASLVPGGINVEMCWLDSRREFATHAQFYGNGEYDEWYGYAVYERGVGLTLSCGTGAVAVCAALRSRQSLPPSVLVISEGGPLEVTFDDANAILRGPVSKVADLYIDSRRLGSS